MIQNMQPDAFFIAEQQKRLGDLMEKWRAAHGAGRELDPTEQTELKR